MDCKPILEQEVRNCPRTVTCDRDTIVLCLNGDYRGCGFYRETELEKKYEQATGRNLGEMLRR